MGDSLRSFESEYEFPGDFSKPGFEGRGLGHLAEGAVAFDGIELLAVKWEVLPGGEIVGKKFPLPFAISVAARANIELHAVLIAIKASFVYRKTTIRLLAILVISVFAARAGWVAGHEIIYKETPGVEVVFK